MNLTMIFTSSGGYQQGHFKQVNQTEIPGVTFSPDKVSSTLYLGIIGAEGRFFVPYCPLENVSLTGHALWGYQRGSHFRESYANTASTGQPLPPDFPYSTFAAHGKLQKDRTYDYNVGLGYLLDLSSFGYSEWALRLEGGYAYNKQTLISKHADAGSFRGPGNINNFFVENDPAFQCSHYLNRWESGWLGARLLYASCDWNWGLGYHYHIASYHGHNTSTQADIDSGFYASYLLKSPHAQGNVWDLHGDYNLGCGLTLGGTFTYEYRHAKRDSVTITNPPEGNSTLLGTEPKTPLRTPLGVRTA